MNRKVILGLCIIFIVVIGVIGVYLVFNKNDNKTLEDFSKYSDDDYIQMDNGDYVYFPEPTDIPLDIDSYDSELVSNIDVDEDYLYFDFSVDWFKYTDMDLSINTSLLSALSYTINKYYNGNVPNVYYFDSTEDIIEQPSNMYGVYKVKSNENSFIISVDFKTNSISIEECK